MAMASGLAMAREGIPLPLIQRRLGHSHLSTTGTYLKESPRRRSSPLSTPGARR
jgi:integrase